jgi:hypothetical protein
MTYLCIRSIFRSCRAGGNPAVPALQHRVRPHLRSDARGRNELRKAHSRRSRGVARAGRHPSSTAPQQSECVRACRSKGSAAVHWRPAQVRSGMERPAARGRTLLEISDRWDDSSSEVLRVEIRRAFRRIEAALDRHGIAGPKERTGVDAIADWDHWAGGLIAGLAAATGLEKRCSRSTGPYRAGALRT